MQLPKFNKCMVKKLACDGIVHQSYLKQKYTKKLHP